MKDYDVYLFDWDGTLAQTLDVWMDALRIVYQRYGINESDARIALGLGNWHHSVTLGIPEEALPVFKQEVEQLAAAGVATPPLFEGVRELLADLKSRNKKIALISSSQRNVIDTVVAHHELSDYFDMTIAAEDVTTHKPDPEGIHAALTFFDVDPSRAVMIGDSDKDLGAAANAKIDSILFYPPLHHAVHDKDYLLSFKPVHTLEHWSHWSAATNAN